MLPQKFGLHKTDYDRFRLKTKICEVLSHLADSKWECQKILSYLVSSMFFQFKLEWIEKIDS